MKTSHGRLPGESILARFFQSFVYASVVSVLVQALIADMLQRRIAG
ncbi:MAG: hypothetical protein WAN72_22805 [Candidatus Acidiferrales bacterium]